MKAKNPYFYTGKNPTVDLIVFNEGKVLLIKRREDGVEGGKWAFPGGFHDTNAKQGQMWENDKETVENAAFRELEEETCLNLNEHFIAGKLNLQFVGIYEGNKRDPRDNKKSWSSSSVFMVDLPLDVDKSGIRGADDAEDVDWFTPAEIKKMKLAFDHSIIFEEALFFRNQLPIDFEYQKTEKLPTKGVF